jgi:3-deoxy-D-manno-octulosonic-acid transferase
MHRVGPWQKRLASAGIVCQLRSQTTDAITPGGVILWDIFGELTKAYAAACGAFVGGTLAPLGGQNFLEPLTCGLVPVIGPSFETFDWVGGGLFAKGLVRVAEDWRAAAEILLELMTSPPSKEFIQNAVENYLREHQGGTAIAAATIEASLSLYPATMPARRDHAF